LGRGLGDRVISGAYRSEAPNQGQCCGAQRDQGPPSWQP